MSKNVTISNSPKVIAPILSPKSSKLYEEATKYYEIKKSMGKSWMKDSDKVFIIDKNWVNSWKAYVNYKSIKQYNQLPSELSNIQFQIKKEKHPGEITNKKLIYNLNEFLNDGDAKNSDNIILRHDLSEKTDLKFIRADIWNFFYDIYGGGPELFGLILEEKIRNSNLLRRYVEIYLSKFYICILPKRMSLNESQIDKLTIKPFYIAKRKKISDLKQKIVNILISGNLGNSIKPSQVNQLRLWKFTSAYPLEELKKMLKSLRKEDNTLETDSISYLEYIDSRLDFINCGDSDIIIVEYLDLKEKEPNYYFELKKIVFEEGACPGCNDLSTKMLINPCSCKEVWYCSEQCKDSLFSEHQKFCKNKGIDEDDLKRKEHISKMGIVGLQNLGNTCFMNTSLQCISNCWELINYFLRNCYKTDLNEKNPIGTGGVLARAYANLVKNIWYGGKGVYSPWNFKRALATFQPMFSGYQQHDTQEFLNYLLDGLHEDLNRVINKPIVDKDESKKPDNIKALEEWYAFQLRNQSVLVDLLYGQYKSTLYCPNEKCQNISTTFDTFLSISLPLTNKVEPYEVICFFIFYDVSISPIQLLLPFSSECTLMALRNKIGKILDVHPFSFFIVKMDGTGNYDYLVSSTGLLKTNNYYQNANQKPFFLFQINPDLFYNNPENKYFNPNLRNTIEKSNGLASSQILNPISNNLYKNRDFRDTFSNLELNVEETKKLFKEDYEEDESNTTTETTDCFYSNVNILNSNKETILGIMKVNTDDNHGFCSEYIRLVVHLTYHNVNEKNTNISDTFSRDRVIFPRIMYVKTEWTLAELYYLLFQYFFPIINKKNESVEIMWKRIFGVLDTNYSNDTYEFHKKCNYPYRVRVKNVMRERNKPCIMCNELDCRNCLLPFTNEIKIKDIINKYPRSDIGAKIDNTYLYLQDFQRKYHQKWNRDFSLELSWLTEYKSDVHRLNEKVDHDFKIQKSDILSGISIYDCFKKFIKLEKLEDMNEWYCSNCKTHQKATKKMEIYKSPHILIIHLKRFKNMEKLDCLVDFPLVDLDLKQYVISNEEGLPLTYDLFAVANHVGNSGFGHYFSYAKNPINEKWYKFDDASVTNLPQKEIVTPSAYVLFYRRRNLENYIDLEDIYQRKFINYVSLMKSVEENIGTINKYIINPDD